MYVSPIRDLEDAQQCMRASNDYELQSDENRSGMHRVRRAPKDVIKILLSVLGAILDVNAKIGSA
jgi:hypothetical protein